MCLEFTMRLLMCCLTSRMTSSLLHIQSLSCRPFNPFKLHWGQPGYEPLAILSGQVDEPPGAAWSIERLLVERSITLDCALDRSTQSMYSFALNSYLTCCQLHHLDPDPTVNTLPLYITFMSHHIQPRSVRSYLAGIVCELKPSYPFVRKNRYSLLVVRTLKGSMWRFSNPVQKKSPRTWNDLKHVYNHCLTHDNLLFLTMLLVGFFGSLRLGELVQPDTSVRSAAKTSWRCDVCLDLTSFSFIIPQAKTDAMCEGDRVCDSKEHHYSWSVRSFPQVS